jgi:hypothetical protein
MAEDVFDCLLRAAPQGHRAGEDVFALGCEDIPDLASSGGCLLQQAAIFEALQAPHQRCSL